MPNEVATQRRSVATIIVVALLLVGLVIRAFFCGSSDERLLVAKGIAVLLFFALGAAALIVLGSVRQWKAELAVAERQLDVLRDEVLVAGMVARAQMAEAKERLQRDPEKEQSEIIAGLMKQALPLINMVVKKEKSALNWGLAGIKLVRSLVRYFANKA